MTDALYTRCPQCQTFFRVTPGQLKKAKGKVRCGNCSHVFDARSHLLGAIPITSNPLPTQDINPTPPATKPLLSPPLPTATKLTPPAATPPRPSKPPQFIDSIIDDRSRYTNLDELGHIDIPGELSMEIDLGNPTLPDTKPAAEKLAITPNRYEDTEAKIKPATRAELAGIAAIFQEVHEEIHQPAENKFRHDISEEIILNGGVDSTNKLEFDPSELPSAATLKPATDHAASADIPDSFLSDVEKPELDEDEAEFHLEELPVRTPRKREPNMPYSLRSSYTELETQPRPLWLHGLLLVLLLVLSTTLLLQFLMNRHVQLVQRFPSLASSMTQFCQRLPCHDTGQRDLTKIQLISREVRSHPTAKNALLISVSFVNQAEFNQPYPNILLNLSNLNGDFVARRQFSPPEYLDKLYHPYLLMESGTPVHVTLAVIDPGDDAINFEFSFH